MAREGGDRVAVYTRNGMDSLRRFDLAHPPIHNRYYAIWLVGTLLGMAGVAWVVHHFGL